ncbi:hypothetical protein B0H13DRAFT_2316199 [Mycena leptocephala]|nr:hypothetical protein B0H13DRAFT_2316199 [Mycena leptocephala]
MLDSLLPTTIFLSSRVFRRPFYLRLQQANTTRRLLPSLTVTASLSSKEEEWTTARICCKVVHASAKGTLMSETQDLRSGNHSVEPSTSSWCMASTLVTHSTRSLPRTDFGPSFHSNTWDLGSGQLSLSFDMISWGLALSRCPSLYSIFIPLAPAWRPDALVRSPMNSSSHRKAIPAPSHCREIRSAQKRLPLFMKFNYPTLTTVSSNDTRSTLRRTSGDLAAEEVVQAPSSRGESGSGSGRRGREKWARDERTDGALMAHECGISTLSSAARPGRAAGTPPHSPLSSKFLAVPIGSIWYGTRKLDGGGAGFDGADGSLPGRRFATSPPIFDGNDGDVDGGPAASDNVR